MSGSSEREMRHRVIKALKSLHAVPVENLVGPGTPDVNCTAGWIELKSLPRWPVREETPVKIDCLTNEQRIWLLHRHRAGGKAWLLLKVANDWLIFDPTIVAAREFGREWHKQMLINVAKTTWFGGLVEADFLEFFKCSSKT